uniref:Uncharacterized protein n=1 Tax=Arundo donax TaxID=35708 RepID=A0A0A8Y352_ARUDO
MRLLLTHARAVVSRLSVYLGASRWDMSCVTCRRPCVVRRAGLRCCS